MISLMCQWVMIKTIAGWPKAGSRRKPVGRLVLLLIPLVICGCVGALPDKWTEVSNVGEHFLRQGVDAYQESNYLTAVTMFQKSLRHYQSVDDIHGITRSRINLAEVALAIGSHDSARQQLQHARELVDREGLEQYRSRLDLLRATLAIQTGDADLARTLLEPLLPQEKKQGTDSLSLSALANRTRLAFDSDPEQAEQWTRRYAGELQKMKVFNPIQQGRLYRFQAALATRKGDFTIAEQLYRHAHGAYQQAVYRPGIAATLGEWAELKSERKHWKSAHDLLNRALAIRIRILDRRAILEVLRQLRNVNRQLGDGDRAAAVEEWIKVIENEDFEEWSRLKEAVPLF